MPDANEILKWVWVWWNGGSERCLELHQPRMPSHLLTAPVLNAFCPCLLCRMPYTVHHACTGGHEWTSIHQGVVGMELEDDPPAGAGAGPGTPRAGAGAGGSRQHGQNQQRGGATPPALQLDMHDPTALGNSPGASAAAATPSRLSGMRAAWGNLLKTSLR